MAVKGCLHDDGMLSTRSGPEGSSRRNDAGCQGKVRWIRHLTPSATIMSVDGERPSAETAGSRYNLVAIKQNFCARSCSLTIALTGDDRGQ